MSEKANSSAPAPAKSPVGGSEPRDMSRVYRYRRLMGSLIVLAVVGLVIGLVSRMAPREKEDPPPNTSVLNVEVVEVEALAKFQDTFDLPGVVEPEREVTVSAEVAGRVERINCKEGRPCQAGDAMIVLNSDLISAELAQATGQLEVLEAQVAQAEAQRNLAKFTLDSFVTLRASGYENELAINNAKARHLASVAAVTQARAGVGTGKAVLRAAQVRMDRTSIKAPISGCLDKMIVDVGEYLSEGTRVAQIVNVDKVKVVVHVPERDISYLKVGSTERLLSGLANSSGEISVPIGYIGEVADQLTRTTRVELFVDNKARALRSGQIVMVRLKRRVYRDIIMIPLRAVVPLEDGRAVYLAEKGLAVRRDVELGLLKGDLVQVVSGLEVGDKLILEAQGERQLGPGQEIRIVPSTGASSKPAYTAREMAATK